MTIAPSRRTRGLLPIALVLLAGLVLTFVLEARYHHRILTLVLVWATMGLSWNVISGYAGQTSFGHQAYLGIGAFVTVLLVVRFSITPWAGLVAGVAAAVAAAALIGYPTFRLAGIYFALATLAYPAIFRIVMEFLGYQEVAIPMKREHAALYMQFADPRAYDLLCLAVFGGTLVLSHVIETSRLGYALRALRENEQAAEAMGVDTFRAKMVAYMLSAAPAALIGGIYAHAVLFVVTPDAVFGVLAIVQTLVVCLVGGAGSKWGPVIGAAVMVPMSETLDATLGDQFPGIQGVVYGAALVLVMLFAPEGLYWRFAAIADRRRGRAIAGDLHVGAGEGPDREQGPFRTSLPPVPAGAGAVLLEAQRVSKAFAGLQALDNVTFSVRAGEILGIIGPNGAGKTTLFNVLNGFLLADGGEVRHRGQPINRLRPSLVCRRGIGRTFQVVRVFPRMTVFENVLVGAFAGARDDVGARRRAERALDRVGLAQRAEAFPAGLTTLDLRLMELARAVATGPELILLDEPLAGLGRDGVDRLMTLIRGLREEGVTTVIIEHTMYALVQLADRLLVLDHGRPIAEGAPRDVTRQPAVIEAYLGKRWLSHAQPVQP